MAEMRTPALNWGTMLRRHALAALTGLGLASGLALAALPAARSLPASRQADTPGNASPVEPMLVPESSDAKQRGVALGLFAEDVSFSYEPLIQEIAAVGATHVSLVVPWYQTHAASTALTLHTRLSPTLEAVADAIRLSRRAGLEVTLFPIVRLAAPRNPKEWRGTLAPADRNAWFASYGSLLADLAALGALTGASRLVVGSELSSLDGDLARWRPLVKRIRALFPGTLMYSANWDHYQQVRIYDLVDEIGVVAYFKLREKDGPSDVAALTARWRSLRREIEFSLAAYQKPFVFSELGYRSRTGSTAAPWDEVQGGVPDVDEQARAFQVSGRRGPHPGTPPRAWPASICGTGTATAGQRPPATPCAASLPSMSSGRSWTRCSGATSRAAGKRGYSGGVNSVSGASSGAGSAAEARRAPRDQKAH